MSFRLKVTAALVVLTALASVSVGLLAFRSTSAELRAQLDASLRLSAAQLSREGITSDSRRSRQMIEALRALQEFTAASDTMTQAIGPRGRVITLGETGLPVDESDVAIARNSAVTESLRTVIVDGQRHRLLTRGLGSGAGAVQVMRSMAEIEAVQRGIARRIVLVSALVSAVAGLIGWLVAWRLTQRLTALSVVAGHVAKTGDLRSRMSSGGTDEVGRLASALDEMLSALVQARDEQRRLIQNAGHELRTPLTSLRTNVYLLSGSESLTDDERQRVVADLRIETEELSTLVNEVIDLAADAQNDEPFGTVNLGELAASVAHRAGQRSGRRIEINVDDSYVVGQSKRLARCVSNLLENAIKFDTSEKPIRVECHTGVVSVIDNGPGLADVDIPMLFERFYRSDEARSVPGSGLGLAIVAEIIRAHNGYVWARDRGSGDGPSARGAVIGFTLPVASEF